MEGYRELYYRSIKKIPACGRQAIVPILDESGSWTSG
jgi:hypothetical protein